MARDWFKRNRGRGNVLKTDGTVLLADATVNLDANITVIEVVLDAGNVTITGDAANSIIGDQCIITGANISGGSLDVILAGTGFAAGTVSVAASGVFSIHTVFNGSIFAATVTPA